MFKRSIRAVLLLVIALLSFVAFNEAVVIQPLPYAFNALEPFISRDSLES